MVSKEFACSFPYSSLCEPAVGQDVLAPCRGGSLDGKPGTIPVHSHMGSLGSSPIQIGQHLNLPLDSVARGYLVKTEMSLLWFSLVVKFRERQADEGMRESVPANAS